MCTPLVYDTFHTFFSLWTCVTFVITKELCKHCGKLGNDKNHKGAYIFFVLWFILNILTTDFKNFSFEVIVDSAGNF